MRKLFLFFMVWLSLAFTANAQSAGVIWTAQDDPGLRILIRNTGEFQVLINRQTVFQGSVVGDTLYAPVGTPVLSIGGSGNITLFYGSNSYEVGARLPNGTLTLSVVRVPGMASLDNIGVQYNIFLDGHNIALSLPGTTFRRLFQSDTWDLLEWENSFPKAQLIIYTVLILEALGN